MGNLPGALRALSRRQIFLSGQKTALVAGIWDGPAVVACWAGGAGAEFDLLIGSQCDPRHGSPLRVRGTVKRLSGHDPEAGRQVIFQIGEGIEVVLTERRKPFHYTPDFHALRLKPEKADLIVVKMGYLVPDLEKLAAKAYLALTPGAVDQRLTQLSYEHLKRPIFPFDRGFHWDAKASRFYSCARKS